MKIFFGSRLQVYPIIYRYILVEMLKWFLLSFAFFFATFLVNNVLLLAKDVLARQVPLGLMVRLLGFTFPHYFDVHAAVFYPAGYHHSDDTA